MLEAISNRKDRFPIQKHQKLQQYFTTFFNQNKQLIMAGNQSESEKFECCCKNCN
jgi:hypothetical protein